MVERRRPERLFHLTEASNVDSIRRHGLLSTLELLERSGADAALQARVRAWRPEAVRLPDGVLVGDQWCQPPERLRTCLLGGLRPEDWYERLNGFAYLWPGEAAALKHAATYRGRDQRLLVFDAGSLLEAHGARAFVTTFNVGYALRRAKARDMNAFVPWPAEAVTSGRIKEVLVQDGVPDAAAHLLEVRRI